MGLINFLIFLPRFFKLPIYINLSMPRWGNPHRKIYMMGSRYRDRGKKIYSKINYYIFLYNWELVLSLKKVQNKKK